MKKLGIILFLLSMAVSSGFAASGFEITDSGRGFARDRVIQGFHCIGAFGGKVSSWASHDHFAFLAQGCIMHIWDVANPDKPRELSWVKFPSDINTISIKFPAVYVATRYRDVSVIDASNPEKPHYVSTLEVDSPSLELSAEVSGNDLSINEDGKYGRYYYYYDIRDPLKPKLSEKHSWSEDIRNEANSGLKATATRPKDKSTTSTKSPAESVIRSLVTQQNSFFFDEVKVSDSKAYLLNYKGKLTILDVKDPAQPSLLADYTLPGKMTAMAIEDDNLFLCDTSATLLCLDARPAKTPKILGQVKLPAHPLRMAASGNRLLLAAGKAGMLICDTSNPSVPRQLGTFKTERNCEDVSTSGSLAILAAGDLLLVDYANPSKPELKARYPIKPDEEAFNEQTEHTLKRLGNYVFLVGQHRWGGLVFCDTTIIDLSKTPSAEKPNIFAFDEEFFDYGKEAKGKFFTAPESKFKGWYLCFPVAFKQSSGGQSGMYIFDVSDPENPRPIGEYWRLTSTWDLKPVLFKDTIYIANKEDGLLILSRMPSVTLK